MLKWAVLGLALVVGFAISPLAATNVAGADKIRVFIDVPSGFNQTDRATISGLGGETRHVFATSQTISAELPATAVQQLTQLNRFFNVRPVPTMTAIDDTLSWIWGVDQIDAERVWGGAEDALNVQSGLPAGAGVKVAIIDSGIDRDHPDLAPNIIGGRNWSPNGQTVSGDNCSGGTFDSANYEDEHGHGTHVAGTVAAVDSEPSSGASVIGVAPKASLLVLRALDKCGSGYMDDIAAAVEWASVPNSGTKADIISMSLGCYYAPAPSACDDPVLRSATNAAYSTYGVLVVAAAGNSGAAPSGGNTVGYPAMYDGAMAVASTDSSNNRSSFSSTGVKVEIAAPGSSVTSTYLNGGYATMSGTSMATPHVAGLAALVKSVNPSFTAANIRARLQQTATDLGASGRDPLFGYGLVDAVDAANGGGTQPPPPTGTTNVYVSCASSVSTTGGDGNGYETNGGSACADDASFGSDNDSGNGTSTSCTSTSRDRQLVSGFGVTLPGGQLVAGIEVRLDAWVDSSFSSSAICVELSADGGNSWTAAKKTSNLGSSQATYVAGGAADTWGRTWNAGEVANLSVRLMNVASSTSRDFRLDYVAVKVTTAPAPSPIYDLAVTSVSVTPTSPVAGTSADVSIGVSNQGNQPASGVNLTLTDSVSGGVIGTQAVTVGAGQSTSLNFSWNTTGAAAGAHSLDATLAPMASETDTADNTKSAAATVLAPVVDLAVSAVTATPANPILGATSSIKVSISNAGNQNASQALVQLTDGIGGPELGSQTLSLNAGQATDITFAWITAGATLGAHTIVASIPALPGEGATSNNSGETTVTVLAVPPGPVSTGYAVCTGNSAVTSSGNGDRNGFESNAGSACADDASFASDNNSGSNSSTSCTSSSRDRHLFNGFAPAVPSGVAVNGIQVRLDAWADSSSSSPRLCVALSSDGGTTWTSAKQSSTLSSAQATYVLGSPTDTWGRSWTATDANNLMIRVTMTASSTSRDFRLDYAAIQVTYTAP